MLHTSSPGVLVFGPDGTVRHVDAETAALLDADPTALLDGTAEVLRTPVTSAGSSYETLGAFVDALPADESGPVFVTLPDGRNAEARVTHNPDGPAGVVLLVHDDGPPEAAGDGRAPLPPDDQSRRLLEAAVEHTRLPVLVTEAAPLDAPGPRITYANPAFTEVTGYTLDEVQGESPRLLQGRQTSRDTLDRIRRALEAHSPVRETVLNYRKDGAPFWNDLYIAPVEAPDGTVTHFVSIQDDVTNRRRDARLRNEQVRLLERIATGTALSEVLEDLISFIETERPGLLGSVLLLDPEDQTLHHRAAPSLPDGYVEAIDGLRIGPRAGSCGAAVFHDDAVVVEDISTDERWTKCRTSALDHGLRACWSTPIHGEAGEVLGTFALYYDAPRSPTEADRLLVEEASHIAGIIIEHDRQKQALRLQEEQFQRLVENAQPIVFLLDAEGTFLLSEGEDLRAVGLEPGELVGTSIYDRYSEYPELLSHIDRALEGETVDATVEVEGVVFDIWYAPYYDRSGTVAGCIGMAVDVTDRREMEKRLRSSEARFRGLFEEAALGIALVDPNGTVVEANPELASMLDAPRFSLRGRSFSALVSSASDGAGAIPLDDLATGTRDRYEAEGRFVRDDGALFWGHVTVSPHSGPGDAEVIVMIEDVSSRKAYEEQLRDAKQKAEEASRLKSALLANMSHEIRTPLTSIIGFAGVLADNLSGSNARYARLAHQSGQRLMDTLNSVLQLSKLEAGVVDLDTKRMDLVAEVRQTLDLYRPQAETAAVELQFAPSVETLHGQWAPTAVKRILSNLLGNALKFTPSGGTVTVRMDRADSAVVLEVEDTGIGIDADFRPRAFDAFTQESQGLQREHEGSGLGLSIVQRLVDLLGGTIELESTKGEGTRARVRLPHDA